MPDEESTRGAAVLGQRGLFIALAAVAGAVVFYVGMVLGSASDVPANTTVLGVQIGGMSRAEAVQTLEQQVGPQAQAPIAISAFDTSEEIYPSQSGLAFDPIATVDEAVGRIYNPVGMVMRLFGPQVVAPVVVIDEPQLEERLASFAEFVAAPSSEPTIHYEDDLTPVLTPPEQGRDIDLPAATDEVANAYLREVTDVHLPEIIVEPDVGAQAADEFLYGPATTAVSGPVEIRVQDVYVGIDASFIAASTYYEVQDGELTPVINGALLHEATADQLETVETPGNNATFAIDENNTPYVVPSQVGEGVSDEDLAAAVAEAMFQTEGREATAIVTVRDPIINTAEAEKLGVVEEISSFTQEVSYAEYLAHNLALASEYINGTLLLPGEVFSMNEKTENHDPKNGYMEGYVIGPGGIFRKELGGGLSAATTTVWSAAFFAGMEPVNVQAHSIYISRYTPGLEATVAWGGFDMKFRNNTEYGVFITAESDETSMTVRMYSTKIYTAIEAEVGEPYWPTDFKTIYNPDEECSAQSGTEGFTIDVDRVFYEGYTEVERQTFTTAYSPSPKVICGKKPKPDKPEPDPDPTDSPTEEPTADPTEAPATDPTEEPPADAGADQA